MGRPTVIDAHDRAAALERLFGSATDLAIEVYDTIASDIERQWKPGDIVDATGAKIVDVMMILARLTAAELVHHDRLGSGYRAK